MGGDQFDQCQVRLYSRDATALGTAGGTGPGQAPRADDQRDRADQGAGTREPRVAAGERDPAQGQRVFCPGGARPPVQAMTAFIDEHRDVYGVEPICKVLPIAPSTYYTQAARKANPDLRPNRALRDDALCTEIGRVWREHKEVYGVRKVWKQLIREGYRVARCTVERLMRRLGLQGVVRGKVIKTTISDKALPCPQDKVN